MISDTTVTVAPGFHPQQFAVKTSVQTALSVKELMNKNSWRHKALAVSQVLLYSYICNYSLRNIRFPNKANSQHKNICPRHPDSKAAHKVFALCGHLCYLSMWAFCICVCLCVLCVLCVYCVYCVCTLCVVCACQWLRHSCSGGQLQTEWDVTC